MYRVEEKHYCEVYFKCMAAIETLITELQYLSLVRKCCMNTLLIDTYNAEDWYWPKRIRHSGWFLPFPGRCGALLAVCIDPAFTLTLAKLQTIKKGRDLRTKLKLDIH